MPKDDEILEESQEHDEEGEAAFAEATALPSDKKDDVVEDEVVEEEPEKDGEKEEEEKPSDKEEPEKEEKPSIDKRIEEAVAKMDAPEKKEKPPKKEPEPEKLEKDSIVDAVIEKLSKDKGDDFNLEEYKADYPEDYNAMMKVTSEAVKGVISDYDVKTGELKAENEKLQSDFAKLSGVMRDLLYWKQVELECPGAERLAASDEFDVWLNKQSKGIKVLAEKDVDDFEQSVEHAVIVIEKYNEDMAKEKAAKHDDKLNKNKKKYDDIHSEAGSEHEISKAEKESEKNDAEGGFKEAVELAEKAKSKQ